MITRVDEEGVVITGVMSPYFQAVFCGIEGHILLVSNVKLKCFIYRDLTCQNSELLSFMTLS